MTMSKIRLQPTKIGLSQFGDRCCSTGISACIDFVIVVSCCPPETIPRGSRVVRPDVFQGAQRLAVEDTVVESQVRSNYIFPIIVHQSTLACLRPVLLNGLWIVNQHLKFLLKVI